jgi:hypothetical protein
VIQGHYYWEGLLRRGEEKERERERKKERERRRETLKKTERQYDSLRWLMPLNLHDFFEISKHTYFNRAMERS